MDLALMWVQKEEELLKEIAELKRVNQLLRDENPDTQEEAGTSEPPQIDIPSVSFAEFETQSTAEPRGNEDF
ncbi:hypothetical protein DD581_34545 [Klebsiella pneumoniae]|nr:hypothetical protein DD581_34545 [Klebsiella pneumoniae]